MTWGMLFSIWAMHTHLLDPGTGNHQQNPKLVCVNICLLLTYEVLLAKSRIC